MLIKNIMHSKIVSGCLGVIELKGITYSSAHFSFPHYINVPHAYIINTMKKLCGIHFEQIIIVFDPYW